MHTQGEKKREQAVGPGEKGYNKTKETRRKKKKSEKNISEPVDRRHTCESH